jgi:hypothetical protein
MSTTSTTTPDVERFVAAVRAHFADLDPDEREDLLDGLEADTADLVAEQGTQALGDPATYAAELRAAAGVPPAGPLPRRPRAVGASVDRWLDGARRRWDAVATGLPGDPWGFALSLRPAWWLLRAYVAVQLVDLVLGDGSHGLGLDVLPSLRGYGAPVLLVAMVVSVQIGRGRLWPARGGAGARVLLLALNLVAVALTPVVATSLISHEVAVREAAWYAPSAWVDPGIITYQGRRICTLRVVDKEVRRVKGLRVLDVDGGVLLPMNTPGC